MGNEKDNNLFLNKIFYIIAGIIILLGIYIRTWTYLRNIPFTSDEALLGKIFLATPVLNFFNGIETIFKIPPLWGILEKIITNIFGLSFFTFRLIPYLTSILSVIAFFFLLKNIFKSKIAVIIGLILFIINVPLVFFTVNFRPYESDVLICILLLLSYKYVSFKEITFPRCFLYTLISILTILFSFTSIFIIPAIIFAKSIEEKKFNKKSLIILSGIIICCLYLYFIDMKTYQFMNNYWQTVEYGFINPSFNSIKSIIIQAIIYTYTGTNLLWIQLTLCCLGFINFFKQKKQYRYLILFIILFSLLAGILKIYPVVRRHILYLTPIIIIYTVAIIDTQGKIIKNTFLKNLINMLIAILIVFTMEIKITNIFPFNLDTYYYEMDTIDTRYEMDQNLYKLIDESKENDFFLIPNEITIMMYFYNVMYNFNKFLNTISFPYETIDVQEVEDFTLEKIQIKPKDITLYIVSVKKSNSIIPDETFIEDILKKQNYKYEKQSDDCMYIFKVYNKT